MTVLLPGVDLVPSEHVPQPGTTTTIPQPGTTNHPTYRMFFFNWASPEFAK